MNAPVFPEENLILAQHGKQPTQYPPRSSRTPQYNARYKELVSLSEDLLQKLDLYWYNDISSL